MRAQQLALRLCASVNLSFVNPSRAKLLTRAGIVSDSAVEFNGYAYSLGST